jgi:hypothetical protein
VADGVGDRWQVTAGEGVFIARGEIHAKGSDSGMTALMIQIRDLELADGLQP